MKIAITSQNFKTVTNHAGKARRYLVFKLEDGKDPVEVQRLNLPKNMSFGEFHGTGVHPVDIADVLLSASFGTGFARRMQKRGIIASLTQKQEPLEAIKAYLESGQTLPPEENSAEKEGHSNCDCHDRPDH